MKEQHIFTGTLAEMIDKDICVCDMGSAMTHDGFTVGKRGKQKFYMWDPTPNGFYKIYPQDERGNVYQPRYVDANKTIVYLWPPS